jgi:hypothetical protein
MADVIHLMGEWNGQSKKCQAVDFLCEPLRSLRLCGE